jgi:sugar/nucleoside kinase (ribokinase family)
MPKILHDKLPMLSPSALVNLRLIPVVVIQDFFNCNKSSLCLHIPPCARQLKDAKRKMTEMPLFTSLGMFIIDEIHFADDDPRPPVFDIIGGAGTFSAVAARLFLPGPAESGRIGWIVDAGNDFPDAIRKEIENWQTGVMLRETPQRQTTRGWNKYTDNEQRLFKYLAPKQRITALDIISNWPLIASKSFHLICSPKRCLELTSDLRAADGYDPNAVIVWEPVPDECKPENLEDCIRALKTCVGIFSPNAREAAMFLGLAEPLTRSEIEQVAAKYETYIQGHKPLTVLRCGKLGCFIANHGWFPAYHNPRYSNYKVVDPTGGGNSFVGGFAVGYVKSGYNVQEAAAYGSVAAGLAIEQIGLPHLGVDSNGGETWNGETIASRLVKYRKVVEDQASN